jgi:chemotaxis signal transduction protein
MGNYLIKPSDEPEYLKVKKKTRSLKIVVFSVGNINVALRVESVQKVISKVSVYSTGVNYLGVADIGGEEITVIDLHKRFFKSDQQNESNSAKYLIITENSVKEKFAILVVQTPTLMEVPLEHIRTIPESYRRGDTLEIASHVAIIPQESTSLTVFLLDPDRLLFPHLPRIKIDG